jgi:transcriptional regulator with XRE-family HTH domain
VSAIATHLADNLRQLREARGLSQQQMAKLAAVPRPTWSNLESGAGNPTLSILVKVASALSVSIEELLGPPREAVQLYRAADLPVRKRGEVALRRLVPDATPGLELDRMDFPPGARLVGIPHRAGTREYLALESGRLVLSLSGTDWELGPGDVIAFRGDQKHVYVNPAKQRALAYSLVMLAPAN